MSGSVTTIKPKKLDEFIHVSNWLHVTQLRVKLFRIFIGCFHFDTVYFLFFMKHYYTVKFGCKEYRGKMEHLSSLVLLRLLALHYEKSHRVSLPARSDLFTYLFVTRGGLVTLQLACGDADSFISAAFIILSCQQLVQSLQPLGSAACMNKCSMPGVLFTVVTSRCS